MVGKMFSETCSTSWSEAIKISMDGEKKKVYEISFSVLKNGRHEDEGLGGTKRKRRL
jgi:hypothetical protein